MDLDLNAALDDPHAAPYDDAGLQLGAFPSDGAGAAADLAAEPVPLPPPDADGSMPPEERARRKRRREEWERQREGARRWDLQRRLADVSADVELLSREVSRLRGELHVPLPPLSALPAAERAALGHARSRRQAEVLGVYCKKALTVTMAHKWSWPFNHPVDLNIYHDYLEKVKEPVDFGTIRRRLDGGGYSAADEFLADVRRVFDNARAYNKPGSDVFVMANTLQEKFEDRFAAVVARRVAEEAGIAAREEDAARRRHAGVAAAAGGGAAQEAAEARCAALVGYLDQVAACVADAKSAAAAACAPVPRADKEALCGALARLPQAHFEAAVGLVMSHHPGLQPFDDVAFDLDQLDALTLRQVASFAAAAEAAEAAARRGGGAGGGKAGSVQVAWPGLPVGTGAQQPNKTSRAKRAAEAAEAAAAAAAEAEAQAAEEAAEEAAASAHATPAPPGGLGAVPAPAAAAATGAPVGESASAVAPLQPATAAAAAGPSEPLAPAGQQQQQQP
jgi:hypothetical protein